MIKNHLQRLFGASVVVIPTISQPRNRILAALPSEIYEALQPSLELVALSAQQVVQVAEAPISAIYFPESSWLSLSVLMENGDGIEVGTIGREGMVGYPALVGAEHQELDAVVQGAGWAWRIEAQVFRAQIEQAPLLRDRLLRHMMAHHGQVVRMAACHGSHYAGQRLARWLLMAHDRAQVDAFPVTHEAISNLLGVRRASVTVAASLLQKAGIMLAALQAMDRLFAELRRTGRVAVAEGTLLPIARYNALTGLDTLMAAEDAYAARAEIILSSKSVRF